MDRRGATSDDGTMKSSREFARLSVPNGGFSLDHVFLPAFTSDRRTLVRAAEERKLPRPFNQGSEGHW